MTRLLASLLALLVSAGVGAGQPLALLMFDAPDCRYCRQWDDEVGVVYPRTAEGRAAPLRRVALHSPMPHGLELADEVLYTPTFVLLRGDSEIGRITGYPGEDHFWGLLGAMLDSSAARGGGYIQP